MDNTKKKKLILIDTNNQLYIVLFSRYLFEKYDGMKFDEADKDTIESLFRDSLKMMLQKYFNILEYNKDYDLSILYAKDSKRLWRRKRLFKEYKSHRKKEREQSKVDFKLVYHVFDQLWDKMKDTLPHRFIETKNAEVDDIISRTIEKEYYNFDEFEIISTDGDFIQLMKFDKVKIYNPKKYAYVESKHPRLELFEKIIRGDKSDNIPNIYSSSRNERQLPIRTASIEKWYNNYKGFKEYITSQTNDIKKNFIRNKKLIDMKLLPYDIQQEIDIEVEKLPTEYNMSKILNLGKDYYLDFVHEKIELIP